MIKFQADNISGYPHRTVVNVYKSDMTLLFCSDERSRGIKHTLNQCFSFQKAGFIFNVKGRTLPGSEEVIEQIRSFTAGRKDIIVNVAGNDICNFNAHGISQQDVDDVVEAVLATILEFADIKQVRSGGQTGADEAGIKAADKLGVEDVVCFASQDWLYRDHEGDHSGEEQFKQRFN